MGNSKSSSSNKPDPVSQGGKTGRMTLSNLKLKTVPAQVWLFGDRLRLLDLSNNGIKQLGSQIGSLAKLQTLKLSHNLLESLPEELYHLEDLKVLIADHNKLDTVAAVLPRKNLRQLDLSHNAFTGNVGHPNLALPPCVVTANLSFNPISGLNESFGWEALSSLEELDLDSCSISELPAAAGCLTKLRTLKLRNNQITTLPQELFETTELNRLHLENNPTTLASLATIPSWEKFLERREQRISKGIAGGLHPDMSICGLD